MASTTIYEVKADLLTNLQAASALSGVQVTYGDPGGAARRESIFLGDVDSSNQIPESLSTGRRRRIEGCSQSLTPSHQKRAGTALSCNTWPWTLIPTGFGTHRHRRHPFGWSRSLRFFNGLNLRLIQPKSKA